MDSVGSGDGQNASVQTPNCIARTAEEGPNNRSNGALIPGNNFYRETQWSPDGTCLITHSADNSIGTYVVPPDLLNEEKQPHELVPYSVIKSSEPVRAYVCYPGYHLPDPSTTLVLSSWRDLPIRLNNALDGSKVASYSLVNPLTEKFISPHSLLFSRDGSRFVAGSENLISVFDVSRVADGPMASFPTNSKEAGVTSMRGIVSAFAVDETSGMLAAGTFSRHVGLYDDTGQGECVGVFCVDGTDADKHIGGAGITQVEWSSSGRYLYIAERKSDGVMFYDIRKTGQLLGWLVGRSARTNQRLGVDIANSDGFDTVWAGGVDGCIRQWRKPHEHEGAVEASKEWHGHNDAVSSVACHQSGSVTASCSGARHEQEDGFDMSLKIWENR